MKIQVNIDKKFMPHDKKGNREEIVNYIVSFPDVYGKIRHNTIDQIVQMRDNFNEVISEFEKWEKENIKKEGVK